jgi:hypothetical protein
MNLAICAAGVVAALFGSALSASASTQSGFTFSGGVYRDINPPGSAGTAVAGINNQGAVAGQFQVGPTSEGFVEQGGIYNTIIFPGSALTVVQAINDSGVLTGDYLTNGPGPVAFYGFIESAGVYHTISPPDPTNTSTFVSGINQSGQVVGSFNDAAGASGFIYANGAYTTLNVPGALFTSANAINDAGVVVGQWSPGGPNPNDSFTYSGGVYTLINRPGADFTSATAINDHGDIAGTFFTGSNATGFIKVGNVYTDISVPGADSTFVNSLNATDSVAGYYFSGTGEGAFVETGGVYTLITPPGLGSGIIATSINDSGVVAGSFDFVPEPGAWALVLAGFGGLGLAMRSRRRQPARL